jgi:hypothetical protein
VPVHTSGPEKAVNLESEMPEPRKSLFIWIVIVGIGLVGIFAAILIPAFTGQKPTTNPPVGLYVMLWTGLFFYLMWKQQDKKSWQGTLIGLGVGFFVYTGAIMVASSNRSLEEDKAALEQIVDMVEEFYEESNKLNPDGTPAPVDKIFAPSSDALGSVAIMQKFIADLINLSAATNNEYLSELDSIGWNNLFDSDWLNSDPTMKKSWHMVTEARAIVDTYERRTKENMANARNNIQYLEMSDPEKEEFLVGFDRGSKNAAEQANRMWELEKFVIDETEKMINLLAEDRNSWIIENEQFLFETDEQIARFNDHVANIEKLSAEQMDLQNNVIKRQREELEAL